MQRAVQFQSYIYFIFVAIFCLVFISAIQPPLYAQTDIFIRGSGKKYPIALPRLCLQSGDTNAASAIPEAVARNLTVSGFFDVLNPNAYIETPGKCTSAPGEFAFSDWSVIGADGLVRGVVTGSGDNLKIQLFLFDVPRQQMVMGREYAGNSSQLRLIADRFSNEVLEFFTRQKGEFGSQIVFTSRIGRFKELFSIGIDGSGLRQLTNEKGLAIAPSWSPSGNAILYTSYQRRVPELFIYRFSEGKGRAITNTKDLEIGGSFAPDGRSIVTSISKGKQSNLVLMKPDGTIVKKLTNRLGVIDVSPNWSPDGSKILFCSNRAGGPQIYVMNQGNERTAKRLSFVNSNYCTSPSWSPAGDRIAFVCRANRGFQVFTARPDGSDPLQITSSGNNEDPEWSPSGQHLVFATTYGKTGSYNIAVVRADGTGFRLLTESRADDADPSWGPVP